MLSPTQRSISATYRWKNVIRRVQLSTVPIKDEGKQRPIFVAATKQHVGKTSTSLALLSGLQKRFDKVGFIKPVGQQHVPVFSKILNKEISV